MSLHIQVYQQYCCIPFKIREKTDLIDLDEDPELVLPSLNLLSPWKTAFGTNNPSVYSRRRNEVPNVKREFKTTFAKKHPEKFRTQVPIFGSVAGVPISAGDVGSANGQTANDLIAPRSPAPVLESKRDILLYHDISSWELIARSRIGVPANGVWIREFGSIECKLRAGTGA